MNSLNLERLGWQTFLEKFSHTPRLTCITTWTHDEEILSGELLTILRLMLGQLRKARLLQYRKAPVILYLSFPLPTVAYHVLCRSFWSRLWVNVLALLSPITTVNPSSYVLPNSTISPRRPLSGSKTLQNGIWARQQGTRSSPVFIVLSFFFSCSASESVGLFAGTPNWNLASLF